ncbi:MAG TPA: RNA methyltransferase [Microvirga sp.]|nr:RNA methyltransferase [Microvirga sp.]
MRREPSAPARIAPVPITDADDPRIEPYRALRERDLVGRADRFVAEGAVVLRVLLTRSRFPVESLLIADNRLGAVADLLNVVPAQVPIYVAAPTVMDAIAGFPIHRGILAVGRRTPVLDPAGLLSSLPPRAVVVGLIGLANHDNVGGVFRNAAAFGADAILLDATTCDPLYRKAIRVSVGATLMVPFARAGSADALLDSLEAAGFDVVSLSPAGGGILGDLVPAARTALLLGSEGGGLPARLLARTRTVAIPMVGGFDSLNVATTSGIALYHLAARANGAPGR